MANALFDGLLGDAETERMFARIPAPGKQRWYSYQDVLDVSARFANILLSKGVMPGDRVAVQVPKSIEALMLYLGAVRCGAVFLPLNTGYTASEIAYFLEDAKPALFVCDPKHKNTFGELTDKHGIQLETMGVWAGEDRSYGSLLDMGLEASTQFENVDRDGQDLAAILYTSGTTGRSKGAMLTHNNLLSNAATLVDYWKFDKSDILLHALPIFHTHGLFVATNVILKANASMIFLPEFEVGKLIEYMPESTSLMGVPTFYTRLLNDNRFSKEIAKHMRLFISGSAPLLAETHQEFKNRTGHKILERYGMTETNMNTSNPYEGERRGGTVGFPLPDVDVRIVDAETGQELPENEVGVLEVRGPNVFSGYWQMPEKTRDEFREDGFFITGDLAKKDADGYIHIVGREKDLIISGGYNIYPKELELILDEQIGVLESAVIGVPHDDFGEAVVGVVVPNKDAKISEEMILNDIKEKIARFKQPKAIVLINELPRNTMGKVQKNALRERYKDLLKA